MSLYDDLPTSYMVAHIRISPNIVLAPMVGVTDSVFRRMILGLGGCGLVSSEMTNAASISPRAIRQHHQLDFLPEERPITMQLSGNDPDLVASAARLVEQHGADILDLNCGCPSPKVTGGGHGSALLRDLPKMERMLRAVKAAVQIPVTLKFRSGWDEQNLNYLDTARMAESVGVAALALHARTRAQAYTGLANWAHIAEVKRAVRIPVIGNGDARDAADALERLRASAWLLRYLELCQAEMGERLALNKLKQLAGQFVVALPGSAVLRSSVHRATTLDAAREQIELFFAPYLEPAMAGAAA
jgi:nifR3 family TIM-barrel protein